MPRRTRPPGGDRPTPAAVQLRDLPWQWIATGAYVLALGVVSFGFWTVGGYGVETDAFAGYLPDAKRLLHGAFTTLDGFKGPGYHLALAAVGAVIRDFFYAAKILALASSGAVLLLLYRLVRRHIGAEAAWITWIVVATNAQFVLYAIQVGTDMYFLALAMVTATLLLERSRQARTKQVHRALIAGALAGMCYLTRYNGLFLILGGVLILLLADWREIPAFSETSDERPTPWRTRSARAVAFIVAAVVVILPWSLFTYAKGRGFLYNLNYLNIAYELYGQGLIGWDQYWEFFRGVFTGFGDVLAGYGAATLFVFARNGFTHLWADWTHVLATHDIGWTTIAAVLWGAIALTGLIAAILRYGFRAWPPVLLGLLTYGVLVPVFYGERFSLPMLPWYAVLAAVSATWAASKLSLPTAVRFAPSAVLVFLVISNSYGSLAQVRGLLASSPDEIRMIADVAGSRIPEGERIMARKPHIAWYLGLDMARIPMVRGIDDLRDAARNLHTKYLFVSGIEAALRRPLIPLLDPRNAPPFLNPLAATRGRPAVLYEFTFDVPPLPPPDDVYQAPDRSHEPPLDARIGRAYLRSRRPDLAIDYFQRELDRDPDSPAGLLGLVELDVDRARQTLDDQAAGQSGRMTARTSLQDALRRLAALAEQHPESFIVQRALGEEFARQGDIEPALDAYRRAEEIAPQDVSIQRAIESLMRR